MESARREQDFSFTHVNFEMCIKQNRDNITKQLNI